MKTKYLNMNGFHEEVLDMHINMKNYADAFRQVFQHAFYEKGLELAKNLQDNSMHSRIQLCQIYVQVSTENINKKLLHLQRNTQNKFFLAQTFLLQGKLYQDIAACQKAIENFKELNMEGGELEAINVLIKLSRKDLFPKEILTYALRAVRFSKVFQTPNLSPSDSRQCSLYIELNQLEKCLDGTVIVPPNQGYWISSILKAELNAIKDKEIHEKCRQHFIAMSKQWLRSTKAIDNTLADFKLHKQVMQKGLVPTSARMPFTSYLSTFSIIVELHRTLSCYPLSQEILLGLFSTLSVLHNHAWRRSHLMSLQTLPAINSVVKNEFALLLQKQQLQRKNFASLDDCFKLWRMSLMIGDNSILALRQSLTGNVQKDFISIKNPQSHIFLLWIMCCESIASGRSVSYPLHCVYSELITPIAHSKVVRESISDENLLYIMIIETVSALYLASLGWKKTFFIPDILRYCVSNFDLLNAQTKGRYSIARACVLESQNHFEDLSRFGRYSVNRLQKLLDFLLGLLKNSTCNILSEVLTNENETISMYFVVLILVISANLYVARPTMENQPVHNCLVLLVTQLDSLRSTKTKPSFVDYVRSNLMKAQNVSQLFHLVQKLLESVKNTDICYVVPNRDGSYLNIYPTNNYPSINVKLVSPNYELEKQLLQDSQLEEIEELPESEIFEPPAADDQQPSNDDMISILKENLIENNFCKICNLQISSSHFAAMKMMDNTEGVAGIQKEESEYDQHIASIEHKMLKSQYQAFVDTKKNYDSIKAKIITRIKKSSDSPEDDIKLTKYEQELSHINDSIESLLAAHDNDWLNLEKTINSKATELQTILEDIDERSYSKHDNSLGEDDPETPLSPDIEDDILPSSKLEHKPKKRKH